jgi:flagellar hook assembly protein FlgD
MLLVLLGLFSLGAVCPLWGGTVTLFKPNGGESGPPLLITWTSSGLPADTRIKFDLFKGPGPIYQNTEFMGIMAEGILVGSGVQTYTWNGQMVIPRTLPAGNDYWLVIQTMDFGNNNVEDDSDAPFTLNVPPPTGTVTLLSPNGGENCPITISWTSSGLPAETRIKFDLFKGSPYNPNPEFIGIMAKGIPVGSGVQTYTWNGRMDDGSNPPSGNDYWLVIQTMDFGVNNVEDACNGPFTMCGGPPIGTVTLLSPNGGENCPPTISWTSSGLPAETRIKFDLFKGPGPIYQPNTPFKGIMAKGIPVGSGVQIYTWNGRMDDGSILPAGNDYWLVIQTMDFGADNVEDASDAPYSICGPPAGTVTLLSPNGGSWDHKITWTSSELPANTRIKFDLFKGPGPIYQPGTPFKGILDQGIQVGSGVQTYTWNGRMDDGSIPPEGTDYWIVIQTMDFGVNNIEDASDAPFTITNVPETVLGISPTNSRKLAINGNEIFLFEISYFNPYPLDTSIDANKILLEQDLQIFKDNGFNCIRVSALEYNYPIFKKNGEIYSYSTDNPYSLNYERIKFLIEKCNEIGIIIDFTLFYYALNPDFPTTVSGGMNYLSLFTNKFGGYKNWFWDVYNEWDAWWHLDEDPRVGIPKLLAAVKSVDLTRLCTASNNYDKDTNFFDDHYLDIITPHSLHCGWTDKQGFGSNELLATFRSLARDKPIHLQEPARRGYSYCNIEYEYYPPADRFLNDLSFVRWSIDEAAGWCFHNHLTCNSFPLDGNRNCTDKAIPKCSNLNADAGLLMTGGPSGKGQLEAVEQDVVHRAAGIIARPIIVDFIGTWDGQGVYYRNSETATYVKLATPATLITAGDLDGDAIADLIGIWPGQGGVWVKYSQSGSWAKLSSTAIDIACGDMNGDGRDDLVATWDGQGVYYRNSIGGAWVKMATPAEQVTAGDLDGDGKADLIGIWPGQGGVWVKYSQTNSWAKLSTTAIDIACNNMNGDGRDDLVATWDGQGVYYRNSLGGVWVMMATPATLVTAGDLDGDNKADVIGIWPSQGGVWVKYSQSGNWEKLSTTTARHIATGLMRGGTGSSPMLLAEPFGGVAAGPGNLGYQDIAAAGPGDRQFQCQEEKNLTPQQDMKAELQRVPGPGEYGFQCLEQKNLVPGSGITKEPKDKKQRQQQ